MLSMLRTIWTVLLHMFRRPVTVQYPEERPVSAASLPWPDHPVP